MRSNSPSAHHDRLQAAFAAVAVHSLHHRFSSASIGALPELATIIGHDVRSQPLSAADTSRARPRLRRGAVYLRIPVDNVTPLHPVVGRLTDDLISADASDLDIAEHRGGKPVLGDGLEVGENLAGMVIGQGVDSLGYGEYWPLRRGPPKVRHHAVSHAVEHTSGIGQASRLRPSWEPDLSMTSG